MDRACEVGICGGQIAEDRRTDAQTYAMYCNQVCATLKKATKNEKADLIRELTAHMEDHVEALIQLGWDPEEARDYAIEAMGDPATVGRQYDEQLSSFWLVCGYVFRGVLIFLVIWILLIPIWLKGANVYHNLRARWAPRAQGIEATAEELLKTKELDMVIPFERHEISIYRVDIFRKEGNESTATDSYGACIYVVSYAKNPLDPTFNLLGYYQVEDFDFAGGFSTAGASYDSYKTAVAEGQESVTFTIVQEATDTDVRVEIPLDWEGIP